MKKICGIEVEFVRDGSIIFKNGEVKIVAFLDFANDYLSLFEAIVAEQTYKQKDVEFSWSNHDMTVTQGDNKIVLKELIGEQLDIFCMMAAKLLMGA